MMGPIVVAQRAPGLPVFFGRDSSWSRKAVTWSEVTSPRVSGCGRASASKKARRSMRTLAARLHVAAE